jgi:hypothetical protein
MPRSDSPAPPGKRAAAQVILQATAKLARREVAYRGYWIDAWAQAVAAARDAFLPRFMLSSDPPGTAGRIWLRNPFLRAACLATASARPTMHWRLAALTWMPSAAPARPTDFLPRLPP